MISDFGHTLGTEWGAALASKAIWSSAVDGNVFLIAADPVHDSTGLFGGDFGLSVAAYGFTQGVRFAAEQPTSGHRTGLYIALDHFAFGENLGGVLSPTDVPLLSALSTTGGFKALNASGHAYSSLRRLVTSHPRLDALERVFDDWSVFNDPARNGRNNLYAGFQSWPVGYFPVAYAMDMGPATPAALFTPPIEADTGYRHPRPLDPQVCILAKTFLTKQLRYLMASPTNQALASGQVCVINVTNRFRDYPNGGTGNVPTTPVRWVVESGPNATLSGTFTGSDGNLSGGYTGSTTGATGGVGVDVVRIYYDNDGSSGYSPFDAAAGGEPPAASDSGITLTVNWGPVRVSVAAMDNVATEGASPADKATFQISRATATGTTLRVYFNLDGAATLATDYTVGGATQQDPFFYATIPANQSSVNITITPVNDTLAEGPETLRLSLSDSPFGDYVVGGSGFADITITDNDQPTVTISSAAPAGSPNAKEGISTETGRWVISRGTATASDLTVFLDLTGTATFAADYSLDGNLSFSDPGHVAEVVIPANASSLTVTLTALQDSRTEGTETAILTLRSHPSYQVGTAATATVTITDDDSAKLPPMATRSACSAAPIPPPTRSITTPRPRRRATTCRAPATPTPSPRPWAAPSPIWAPWRCCRPPRARITVTAMASTTVGSTTAARWSARATRIARDPAMRPTTS